MIRLANMNKTTRSSLFTYTLVIVAFVIIQLLRTFKDGGTGVLLTGANPTPDYAGQLIVNHIDDYGFIRYEMGYASAVSVVLLVLIYVLSRGLSRVFSSDDE